ncbi:ComEC/Rec2 family competence protein [Paenibacillus foliorum]|uniref:ComEC/Rec2 family competence protein n=1 Tax=Paenibacillus foliorum TaxID=2654974 RepID=UPI00149134D9|nr:MBL fold metallo-hydrolase [Paenibacillus foliorum]
MKLKVLPATIGDCILISFGDQDYEKNILVDGGIGFKCIKMLKEEIRSIKEKNQYIDLLIITHVDDDHISGILKIFEDQSIDKSIIKKVWFNSGKVMSQLFREKPSGDCEIPLLLNDTTEMSLVDGISLEKALDSLGLLSEQIIKAGDSYEMFGGKFTILSPDIKKITRLYSKWEEAEAKNAEMSGGNDYSIPLDILKKKRFLADSSFHNASSIAFIFEYKNKSILMLADSIPSIVSKYLGLHNAKEKKEKSIIDVTKVAHHGSGKNTNYKILDLIDCSNFIISTDGSQNGHPNKVCLARIISSVNNNENKAHLYFNYEINNIFLEEDHRDYSFTCNDISLANYEYIVEE